MRFVIQRVTQAKLLIDNKEVCSINQGLMVLIGFNPTDNESSFISAADKLVNLRIFNDNEDKLNLSVKDIDGEIMVVPNFTLYANSDNGRRPDFINCAKSDVSEPLFTKFSLLLRKMYPKCVFGIFGANMQINLTNDGPVTIIYEKN